MSQFVSPDTLRSYLTERLPFYLELLKKMVDMNSFTANAAGVNRLGSITADAFAGLGFEVMRESSDLPLYGDHLVLKRPAVSDGPTIGLISHLDTVFPPDEEQKNDFCWRIEGPRIYGPGTVDIKGGTVVIFMILSALRDLESSIFQGTNWVVLLNAAEEDLEPSFGRVCRSHLPTDALAGLVFEGGRIYGEHCSVVTARKGRAIFRVEVEGRAAHAGSAHKKGANAIVQLAETIGQINRVTDYSRRLTVNVGTVAGGSVINRVPHAAIASGEMRAFKPEVLDQGVAAVKAVAERSSVGSETGDYNCQVKVDIIDQWAPWPPNEATERLADLWEETGEGFGLQVHREHRGGLSDGNHLWDYVPTLDGLGPSGGNAHCSERSADGSKDQEYVDVDSFVPKAAWSALSIIALLRASVGKPKAAVEKA